MANGHSYYYPFKWPTFIILKHCLEFFPPEASFHGSKKNSQQACNISVGYFSLIITSSFISLLINLKAIIYLTYKIVSHSFRSGGAALNALIISAVV